MDEFLDPASQDALWIGALAHQLQRRWRTVDPDDLQDQAAALACDPALRALSPVEAAGRWLRPVSDQRRNDNAAH